MENVETFIDQLIDEKGLGVEGDVRKQLKLDMMERLLDQIDRASINALPEDKAIELADKLDDENFTDEQVAEFMKNSGVDLERVALETMLQFRLLYLGGNANVDVDALREVYEENANSEESAE
jgi:hypothetical protein